MTFGVNSRTEWGGGQMTLHPAVGVRSRLTRLLERLLLDGQKVRGQLEFPAVGGSNGSRPAERTCRVSAKRMEWLSTPRSSSSPLRELTLELSQQRLVHAANDRLDGG